MPSTYEKIATTTVSGTSTNTVTFSSISSAYTDIFAIASIATISGTSSYLDMQFNSDSATNYSATTMYGTGSVTGSANLTARTGIPCGITDVTNAASTLNTFLVNVMNYSNTTTYKTALCRSEHTSNSIVGASVGMWRNTNAISTITFLFGTGNFRAGSTFTLYGIKSA
jgi:hypothetical protein